MKAIRTLGVLALALAAPLAAHAQVGVGVSITLAQPGVYGRIDLGNAPPPPVVVQQPVLVAPGPAPVAPVYLWVPPGHQRHWRKHCAEYHACGVPVYFVQEDWVHREYEPRFARPPEHREMRGEERREDWHEERRDDRREDRREDRRDDRRDDRR